MARGNAFEREERRQRRGRFFVRLQTGFTALLTLFFMGVSAWSINSIVEQNRAGGNAPAAQRQSPAQAPAASKPAPTPQKKSRPAENWIVNAPK